MPSTAKVAVLLSTYQGARFVREQLNSVLRQLGPDDVVMVRDDGSTDGTPEVVAAMADARICLVRGPNVGFVRSFLWLLAHAPGDAQFVFLCDQDDVWMADKVARATEALLAHGSGPALYCSRLQLVDESLRPLGTSPEYPRAPSFRNALAENIVTGCTAALNREALVLVCQTGVESKIHFHDWWLYLVVSALGTVIHDPQPTALYRQHGSNAIGMGSGWTRYRTMLRFLRRHDWVRIMFDQAENLRHAHGTRLSEDQRCLVTNVFNRRSPRALARLMLWPSRYRQRFLDEFLLRALLIRDLMTGRLFRP